MQQTVCPREDFDKRSEVHNPNHGAKVDLARFGHSANVGDSLNRLLRSHAVGGINVHRTVVVDVDLAARLFGDATDHLSARTNQLPNFVGRNLHGVDARSMQRQFRTRLSDALHHDAENVQASDSRLLKRLFHQFGRHIWNLNVHLQRRNAISRSGHFEVHIAVVIFGTRDVGQNGVLIAFLHQTHRDTRYRHRNRYPRVHHRQGSATNRSH